MKMQSNDRIGLMFGVVAVVAAIGFFTSMFNQYATGDEAKAINSYKGPVAPFAQPIGPAAVCVLPNRTRINVATWTAGTAYTQGAMVESQNFWYMCVRTNSTGTAGTNYPHHLSGEASDGTNTWRRVPAGPRKGFSLYNAGTNTIMVGYGYVPTATAGQALLSGGTWYEDTEGKQEAVYAIGTGTATNGLLSGFEM